MRIMHKLLSATALATAILIPGIAQAQDDPATAGAEASAQDEGTIIVTGSRIAKPGLNSAVPITTMQAGELMDTGNVSLGDALNQLPSMHATFGQANSGGFIGTAGLNLLDLRGLGTARTLVLVNGRRHVTAQPGTPTSVDVNTIPVDLLERVDVVTGGNSAIYGSDAVAGVVNFVLKRDFEGLRVRAQGGVTGRGDRGTYLVPTILAGKTVAELATIPGHFHPTVQAKAAKIGPLIQDMFRQAYVAGVKIAFGTDSGVSNHGDNAREFGYMVEAGMPAAEAILAATRNAADLVGAADRIGSLQPGRFADIIAVAGNPLTDISELRRVTFVMKGGKIVKGS